MISSIMMGEYVGVAIKEGSVIPTVGYAVGEEEGVFDGVVVVGWIVVDDVDGMNDGEAVKSLVGPAVGGAEVNAIVGIVDGVTVGMTDDG